jgi:hypothetical protein
MGLFKKAMVVGVAKKVFDEARKPHNQQKIREAYASFQAKRGGQQSSAKPRPADPTSPNQPQSGPR